MTAVNGLEGTESLSRSRWVHLKSTPTLSIRDANGILETVCGSRFDLPGHGRHAGAEQSAAEIRLATVVLAVSMNSDWPRIQSFVDSQIYWADAADQGKKRV